jgi:hypothetical protein
MTKLIIQHIPIKESRDRVMKKLPILGVVLSVATLGVPVLVHGKPQDTHQDEKKAAVSEIRGMVKADGDAITFVADAGGKFWGVTNPETLKDHVGHHVELSARLNAEKSQLEAMKVMMFTPSNY